MDEEENIFKNVSITLLIILSIIAMVTNGACIYIISKAKELSSNPSSYLIQNLLIVHFLQGLLAFPLYAAKKHGTESIFWKQMICDGFRVTYMMTFYLAVFSVFLITIDRFVAVFFVMRYQELVDWKRVIYFIIGVWVYITLLCLIPFLNFGQKNENDDFMNIDVNSDMKTNATILINHRDSANSTKNLKKDGGVQCHYNQSKLWTTLMLSVNCLVPYIAIVILYQLITYKIHQMETKTKAMTSSSAYDDNMTSSESKAKEFSRSKKITKVSMILSIAYMVTWSPSIVYYILWSVCPDTCFSRDYKSSNAENYVSFSMKYLAFLDAIASPFIYCMLSERFRHFIPCSTTSSTTTHQNNDSVALLSKENRSQNSASFQTTMYIAETDMKHR